MLSPAILEGLHKSKLENSAQLQTVIALYNQEAARNHGTPTYQQLKTAVKRRIDQMMRTRNFRIRNDVVERGSDTKSHKGNKACVERKVGQCFQWKAFGQCSKGDSCSFSHDLQASGSSGKGQRRKRRSSSLTSHSKAKQTDDEGQKSSQGSGSKHENSYDKSEIPCRFKFCKNPSCKFWHPPVCLNYRSEKGCVHGTWRQMPFPTCWSRRKAQQEVKERWCERISCLNEGVLPIGLCISRFLFEKIYSTWTWKFGSKTHRQILQRHPARNQKSVKKGSIARYYPKVCASWAYSLRAEIRGKITRGDLAPRNMRLQSSVGFGKTYLQAQEFRQNYVLCCWWREGGCRHLLLQKRTEEREFVVDSGASMHMMSKKELSSEEMGTVKRSSNPAVVLTANGEVQTHDEAQVFVHNLNQLVTVQLLEETLPVLSLGKPCKDHGYSHEWVSGQEPRALSARQTISYLLSFQGYLSILEAVRLLQRCRLKEKQNKPLETELHQVHFRVQY